MFEEEITMYRLKVFKEVADSQSFRGAADNLNISQPAVSAHIRTLETILDAVLLDRGRTSTLTAAGKIVYDYAVVTLQQTGELVRNVRDLQNASKGRITLGATSTLGRYIMPRVYSSFKKENPYIEMILRVGTTKQIYQMTLNREIDFGFVIGKSVLPGLSAKNIITDELMIVAGVDHPLAAKTAVTAEEISACPFVTALQQSYHHRMVTELLTAHGITINECFMELEDAESIKRVVSGGAGVAALLRLCMIDELQSGRLKKIALANGPIFSNLSLLSRQDKPLTALQKKFLEFFRMTVSQIFEGFSPAGKNA